jgi:hypothetical protein
MTLAILADAVVPTRQRDLIGPDLDRATPLARQLSWLDAVAHDPDRYARLWLRCVDSFGGGPCLMWYPRDSEEADPRIMVGVACDDQEFQRRERHTALFEHSDGVDGFHKAATAILLRRRRYIDNRRTPTPELFRILRAFLATNGRVFVDYSGRVDARADLGLIFGPSGCQHVGRNAEVVATRMNRSMHRHQDIKRLRRIVGLTLAWSGGLELARSGKGASA